MGKKINLALSARYDSVPDNLAGRRGVGNMPASQSNVSENVGIANASAQQRPHVSALKRLGPVNPTPEVEGQSESSQATRFLVTVANDRNVNQPSPTKAPEGSNSFTRPLAPGIRRQQTGGRNSNSQLNSNQGTSNVVSKPTSSIEIIDLEADVEEPPRKVPVTQINSRPRNNVNNSGFGQSRNNAVVNTGMAAKRFGNDRQSWNQTPTNSVARGKTPMSAGNLVSQTPLSGGQGSMNTQNRKRRSGLMASEERPLPVGMLANDAEKKPPLSGGRRKLFVAGFPKEGVKEADLKELFEKHGKVEEIWCNLEKGFGFVKMDTKINAEKAKIELDKTTFKDRSLIIKLASQGSILKVSNLGDFVTNELLRSAFEIFGDLERVCVACDIHSKPMGYGFVEFSNKKRAEMAVRRIQECPFVLSKSPKPVSVKFLEDNDEEEGLSDAQLRPNVRIMQERSVPPRFLEEGTFEFDVAMKWKMQFEFEQRQKDHLELQLRESRERLELEVEDMYKNHKAWALREELKRRQEELERLERFQSGDTLIDTKRAYLDRAAQMREEQFRRDEEMFVKYQEQLRQNAEVHLAQKMSQPSDEMQYGGQYGNGQNYFDQAMPSYVTQELMQDEEEYGMNRNRVGAGRSNVSNRFAGRLDESASMTSTPQDMQMMGGRRQQQMY